MDMKHFQAQVKQLSQQLDTQTPEQRIMYLMSEVGELVDEVIELTGADPNISSQNIIEIKDRIGLEIYDVIWNAVDLANMLEIDLDEAFRKKIEFNEKRRWARSGYINEET